MQVFQNNDRWRCAFLQMEEELRADRQMIRPGLDALQQIRGKLKGNVQEGSQRLRAEHVVTGTPQHARPPALSANKMFDQ
jgi:hypothetical protein